MRTIDVVLCTACVMLVSVGQVLLRLMAKRLNEMGFLNLEIWIHPTSLAAILIYFVAMCMWVWLLGRIPLTFAFSFFGLSFVLVPMLAHRFLGDPADAQTWLGGGVIIAGIVISSFRH